MEQRLLNVVPLISGHQHPEPKVIVLQQIEVLIGTNCLNCGFFIHYTGMIERIAFLCKLHDFCIRFRWHTSRINRARISSKLFHNTGADTHLRMCVEDRHLFFAAIGICNVIAVHPGNQLIFAMFDSLVQCLAKSTVLCETNNVQRCPHLLLLCSNHLV